MGLGKTLQLIGTLQSWFANRRERTALVVAPAFVLPNWLDAWEVAAQGPEHPMQAAPPRATARQR